MQKYADLKRQMGDIIIFYRLGDFYECFFDDALLVSRMLELTLTARDCGSGLRAPMCGVPHHAYKSYAARLVNEGQKVAICEQLEDPALAKGLVKRGIVQVLTPGTMTDTDELDDRKNNFLMSIMCVGNQYGIAVADITTGDFEATQLDFTGNDEHLINIIGKYLPSEILYNPGFEDSSCYKVLRQAFEVSYTARSERDFSASGIRNNKQIKVYGNDKFKDCEPLRSDNGLIFLPKQINAFMSLKVEQFVDLDTHGMFICTVTEARVLSDKETMTYNYYQANVKPKPDTGVKKGWVCKICGYVYEGENLPEDFICPLCKHGAADFEPLS